MAEDNVTIEDLQKQIAELKKSDEAKTAEIDALKQKDKETTESLIKARELNTKLLLDNPSAGAPEANSEEVEDTIESICEDIVDKTNEKYLKRFKNAD